MIFQRVEINKLIAFRFAGIEQLDLQFDSPVHIILGTNGCGKSSLLRELSPLPSPRSAYDAGGMKKLTILHRGYQYILTSDYSNKSAPHSFIKQIDSVNCEYNEGGTTQVQEELVTREFGYTAEVHALVTGAYDFAKMPPGVRRSLLIGLNPMQLGFVLDHHKRVATKIRACKANITMLQERKLLLEQDFLPPGQQTILTEERQSLQADIAVFVEFLHRTEERLRHLPTIDHAPLDLEHDWSEKAKTLRQSRVRFALFKDVPRTNCDAHLQTLATTLASYQGRLGVLYEQMRDIIEERNQHHTTLLERDTSALAEQVALRENAAQRERDALKGASCENPLSQDIIAVWETICDEFLTQCRDFLDLQIPLWSIQKLLKKQQIFQHWQYIFHENQHEIKRLVEEVERLEKQQRIRLSDIPDQPCAKFTCPLYAHFRTVHDQRALQQKDCQQALERLQIQQERLRQFLTERERIFEQQRHYRPRINNLQAILTKFGMTSHFPTEDMVLSLLRTNPLALYHRTEAYVTASRVTHRYRALLAEHDAEQWKRKARKQIAVEEQARLEKRVVQLDERAAVIQERITLGEIHVRQIEEERATIATYQKLIAELHQEQTTLEGAIQYALIKHDREQLQALHTHLKTTRDIAIRRLGEIDHVLQTQLQLQARYKEEVVQQLGRLEQERLEWQWLEGALAKIPVNYTVIFLNSVINTMNHYIAKVFSYPFRLLPISAEEPLDYRFPVKVGNVPPISDISLCSEAQQEIINLTFRLALMKQLSLNDYPIHLDEVGRSFDSYHKQQLLELLRDVIDERIITQMHLVNHHALVHEGLTNADILVLNDSNIMTPQVYNTHATINHMTG